MQGTGLRLVGLAGDRGGGSRESRWVARTGPTVVLLLVAGLAVAGTATATTIGEAGIESNIQDSGYDSVPLDDVSFSSTPHVIATTQTANGAQDPSSAHIKGVDTGGFSTQHCEWDAPDACDSHTGEANGWMALRPSEVNNAQGMETGIKTVSGEDGNGEKFHVDFTETFDQVPLVFTTVQTENGPQDPLNTQAYNINKTGFTLEFCEQDTDDGCDAHNPTGGEKVAWWAIDRSQVSEDTGFEYGVESPSDSNWATNIELSKFSSTPVVLAETATENGGEEALYAEVKDVSSTSFDLRFCEGHDADASDPENACDDFHMTEEVAWVAISPGAVDLDLQGGSNSAPAADFTVSCTDLTCDYDGSDSSDSDGSISGYDWDFGDGTTGTGETVSHTYGCGGTFSVNLTVTDDDGATDTSSQEVTVTDMDTDGDGLTDCKETGRYGTEPNDPDTDRDLLSDGEEVLTYDTDPTDSDHDNDEFPDGPEVDNFASWLWTDRFDDTHINDVAWTVDGGSESADCGTANGPRALYFSGDSTRSAVTKSLDVSEGGGVEFFLKYGDDTSGCDAIESGDEVELQYSTDGGTSWTKISEYAPGSYTSFHHVRETIPTLAETSSTIFRWIQPSFTDGFDHWAIDEVTIPTVRGGGDPSTFLCDEDGTPCAYPNVKEPDLYFEMDGLEDHCVFLADCDTHIISNTERNGVVNTFTDEGINAHFDTGQIGDDASNHGGQIITGDTDAEGSTTWNHLETTYDVNSDFFDPDRRGIFHHMVAVHAIDQNGEFRCGVGETPRNSERENRGDFAALAHGDHTDGECVGDVSVEAAIQMTTLEEYGHNMFGVVQPEGDQCGNDILHDDFGKYSLDGQDCSPEQQFADYKKGSASNPHRWVELKEPLAHDGSGCPTDSECHTDSEGDLNNGLE